MIEIFIGFISGIISGTGLGGGTILILCLSIFLGVNQKIAQATNLIFFIPTSLSAIYVNIKQKKMLKVNLKRISHRWKTRKLHVIEPYRNIFKNQCVVSDIYMLLKSQVR